MSIASEFDSTIENIKSDYEGLENIGADLTNVNKNIQNIRTCLDNIYTNLPKTTGEGSNLSLTTLKGRINVDDILGDTEQDTYEGYNLLPITATSQTISGITITINSDKTITLNGTSTSALGLDIGHCALVSGSYKGNCETNATTNTYYIRLGEGEGDSSTWIANATNNTTFTLSEDKNVYARLIIRNGVTINNVKIYPMLYSGSTTKPYEQYVGGTASPNPSYPQDINVVTGTQEVVVQNKNIYDSSYRTPDNTILCAGGTCTEENGVFTIQATRNDMYVWNVQSNGSTYSAYQNQLIDFIENPYTITITNSLFTKNFITFYDADKKVLNFKQFNTNIFTFTKGQDYSVPSEAKYFSLRFGINDSVSGTTYTTSIQIELGSTATPYTPHQEQTKTLHLSSKNLFQTGFRQGGFGGTEANRIFSTSNAKIKSGVTYTLSTNLDTTKFRYACNIGTAPFPTTIENRVYDSGWKYSSSFTFTALTSGYFGLPVSKNDNSNLTPSDIEGVWWQLEEGSTATTYEPYYNYELGGIGTYKNRIFETSGKNLFDKDTIKEGYLIQVNGEEVANASYGASDYIPIKANTYYTRTNCNNYYGAFYNTNKEFVGAITNANTIISSVDGYVRISFLLTNLDSVMLNEGSSALPYEPYGSDKWYIEKNIGKLILNGSEAWNSARGTSPYIYTITVANYMRTNEIVCMSNYFKGVANGTYGSMTNNEIKFRYYNDTNKDMYICSSDFTTTNDFKTWLSTHNTEVRYVLATPTYEEITNETLIEELNELEKMMSYNGQTNISVSGNLPMILDVSALKGE